MIMCCQRKQSAFMYESDKQIVRFYSLFKKQVFLIYAFIRLKKLNPHITGCSFFIILLFCFCICNLIFQSFIGITFQNLDDSFIDLLLIQCFHPVILNTILM